MSNMLPTIDVVATGQNINKLRLDRGLTVLDIQKVMGFTTRNAVYKWIRGQSLPTVDNFVILSSLFGVKIDDIVILQ